MDRLGLKTIGALSDLPRAALMRRFASLKPDRNPLILLDKALGKAPDPLNAPPDHRHFITRSRLPEPVIDPAPHLPALVDDLCTLLARAELGARRLRLTIYRIDGDWRALGVATARASRDPAHLRRLVRTITASRRIKTLDCSTKMGSDGGTVNPKTAPLSMLPA